MVPPPMNTMLDKQPREEAIRKQKERSSMVSKDVPPTAAGTCCLGNFVFRLLLHIHDNLVMFQMHY